MKKTLLLLLILSACAGQKVIKEPVVVKVPVAVSCHAQEITEPDWASSHVRKDATVLEKLKAVLVDLDVSKGYREELQAQLKACS